MNKRNLTSRTNFKLKEWSYKQVEKHPLLILNPDCTDKDRKTDLENLGKAIKKCPKAIEVAKKLISHLKKYSTFPSSIRTCMYLEDEKAMWLEAHLMEILEECSKNADEKRGV